MKKIESFLKRNLFFQTIYRLVFTFVFRFIGLFVRINKKRILFLSMIGKRFDDSPKALYDFIKNDSFFDDYELIWAFENPVEFNSDGRFKKIKLNSLRYFIIALSSKVWIANTGVERYLNFKKRKTLYIFTGHGAEYKTIGNSAPHRANIKLRNVNYACSSSVFDSQIRIKDLGIPINSIHINGFPTNDVLFVRKNDVDYRNNLRERIGVPPEKKVILYAPTWRDYYVSKQDSILPIFDEMFYEKLHTDFVILVRGHHLSDNESNSFLDHTFYFDGSGQNLTTADALLISDILITDYSSILFEFSILERPLFVFAYDLSLYLNKRGLYMSPNDFLPNNTFLDKERLICAIKNIDYDKEKMVSKQLKDRFMVGNGESCVECINFLKASLIC